MGHAVEPSHGYGRGVTTTGGDAVAEALEVLGVRHVFGIVSVHNLPMFDAVARRGATTIVPCRHEQGAVHAADGYARATGELAVAITSTGPGAANAMSALYEAAFASSPVLMLTGQIETQYYGKGKGFLHEAERQVEMLRSVVLHAASVRRADRIGAEVCDGARRAVSGRPGPVAVEIPIDLQYADLSPDAVPGDTASAARPAAPVLPRPGDLDRAAEIVGSGNRMVFWAGGGVVRGRAADELRVFAESVNAPVVTSLSGRGAIAEDHPLAAGAFTAHPAVAAAMAEADVVVAVGTRFQAGDTRNWSLPIGGRLVHIDVDPGVIGRNYPADAAVVADARSALAALTERAGNRAQDQAFTDALLKAAQEAREAAREIIGPDHAAVMDAIRELVPRDANIVRDATVPAYLWADRLLPVYEPGTSIRPSSAAIGPGLPLAIGAAIGTGRPTVVIHGDGGIMLTIGELATAVQEETPLVVLVFNDGGYGVLRSIQARQFSGRQVAVDLATPDFAGLAQSVGMTAERVSGVSAFREAFERAVASHRPTLLDVDMASLAPMARFGPPPRSEGGR